MFLDTKPLITKEDKESAPTVKKWGFPKRCPFKIYANRDEYLDKILVKYEDEEACWHVESSTKKNILKIYPIGTWKGDQFGLRAEYYQRFIGAIPKGKRVANTCNNHGCLNPFHMVLQDYGSKYSHPAEKLVALLGRSVLKPQKEEECWSLKNNSLYRAAVIHIKDSKTREGQKYTTYQARIVAYEHFIGEIPVNHYVKTSCGNLGCVNPAHFILSMNQYGTTKIRRFGSRIDAQEVREIRRLYAEGASYMELANKYEVPYMVIYSACNYLSWKCIE